MSVRRMLLNKSTRASLAFGGVFTFGIGFSAFHYMPNTFLLNKLKDIVQLYREGNSVPVPAEVTKRFEDVLNDLNIKTNEKLFIKPFTVYGFDIFHAGSLTSRCGALVGIPSLFYCSNVEDVETDSITIRNKAVNWISEAGKSFKNSLVLSDKAQTYLLAREVLMTNSYLMFLKCFYPLAVTYFVYSAAFYCNRKLKLLERPLFLRGIMYTIVSLFGIGLWAFLQDFTTVYYELEADKKLSALDKKYIEGGLEAYSKILQRNVALRELMGSNGPNTYTANGNEVNFLRIKHLPLTHRKDFFESKLKELESDKKDVGKDAENVK